MLLPLKIPEWHYHYPGNGITFKMLETFIEKHFEIGEKYLEYVRYASLDPSCYHCSVLGWAGPVCFRIPKPMLNYNSSGFHYLSVFIITFIIICFQSPSIIKQSG